MNKNLKNINGINLIFIVIQNLCKGFLDRIHKVLELKGSRLEPEHFKKKANLISYNWVKPKVLPNMRIVYNNKKIYKFKKKEMRIIKAELRKIKSVNLERMKKPLEEQNKQTKEYATLIKNVFDKYGFEKAEQKKIEYIRNIRDMLENIQEMDLVEYLEHLKEIAVENKKTEEAKDKNEEIDILDDDTDDPRIVNEQMDNIIVEQRINELINMKQQDKRIKYHIRF